MRMVLVLILSSLKEDCFLKKAIELEFQLEFQESLLCKTEKAQHDRYDGGPALLH